jgi:hypothetical protein
LFAQAGRQYDRLDLKCATNGSKQTQFFDITSFFGKI